MRGSVNDCQGISTAATLAAPPPAPPAAPVPAAVVHLDEIVDVRTIQLIVIFADADVSLLLIFIAA